jgi:hypothetical protein
MPACYETCVIGNQITGTVSLCAQGPLSTMYERMTVDREHKKAKPLVKIKHDGSTRRPE